MTGKPPIPQASQSPYPLDEPAKHAADKLEDFAQQDEEEEEEGEFSLPDLLDDLGVDARVAIGVGAAVALGAVAGITALLFSRRKGSAQPAARKAPKRRAAATPANRKRKPATSTKGA